MNDSKTMPTTYLKGEGRKHLAGCMEAVFTHCRDHAVDTIVMYTANGEGPMMALEKYLSQPRFSSIRIIAVTPAANRTYVADPREAERNFVQAGIFGPRREALKEAGIAIVSARLPFRSMLVGAEHKEPMQLVDLAFGVLGGGFSLCLQAAMMACDAGEVTQLGRVAAMSADTAVVLIASQSESFFSSGMGLLVEHIICRPMLYDISKASHFLTEYARSQEEVVEEPEQLALPGVATEDDDAGDGDGTDVVDEANPASADNPDEP